MKNKNKIKTDDPRLRQVRDDIMWMKNFDKKSHLPI